MKRFTILCCLMLLFVTGGCSQNHYNLPRESIVEQVKILGVAPIIVDADSDIRFPQKEELVTLLTNTNRTHERDLLLRLKNSNSFYAVTMTDGDPKALFASLLSRRERRDDAAIQYNKYFWKEDALRDHLKRNSLDALLLVVVSGITRPEKIRSSNLMDALETDYNYLIMTAQMVDAKGTVLWEYPNFRQRSLSYMPMLNLQYPDFDEAKANMSSKVQVKFKSFEGIKRALDKRRKDLLLRETGEVDLYMSQFDEMVSLIELDRSSVKPAATTEAPRPEPPKEPAKVPSK